MFRETYQRELLSILFSCGSKPLAIWSKNVKNGYIKRLTDDAIKSLVIEMCGHNVMTTYISCPCDPKESLGIRMPFINIVIKNMNKYFTFELQIKDDVGIKRRFRISNYLSVSKVNPFICTMPLGLNPGWNQIHFNLPDFTRKAYGTVYIETVRVQMHANCRLRRIFFTNKLYEEDELPTEYKMFRPTEGAPSHRSKHH